MLKIFLVEDESIMREGLRDNMPWQQFGYEFVGKIKKKHLAIFRLHCMNLVRTNYD